RQGGIEILVFELINDASNIECVAVNRKNFFPALSIGHFGIESQKNVKAAIFGLPLDNVQSLNLISYARNFDLYSFKFPHLALPFKDKVSSVPEMLFSKIIEIDRKLKASSSLNKLEDCEPVEANSCNFAGAFKKPVTQGSYYAVYGHTLNTTTGKKLRLNEDIFWLTAADSEIVAPSEGKIEGFENRHLTLNYGCGLRSHLYPVDLIRITVGDKFYKGQVLGQTARSSSEFIGHQYSLWGHPINNRELEDERWFVDHIIKKLIFINDVVGLKK
ncbi:MAG: hypothetical protein NZO16_07955, partial [Deltaproteobacteria bacterium]|nr:hypothetical protein [Deltaproteobacteria bacterium]